LEADTTVVETVLEEAPTEPAVQTVESAPVEATAETVLKEDFPIVEAAAPAEQAREEEATVAVVEEAVSEEGTVEAITEGEAEEVEVEASTAEGNRKIKEGLEIQISKNIKLLQIKEINGNGNPKNNKESNFIHWKK